MGVVEATSRNYVDDEYLKVVERARRQLRALISNNRCAPIMLRLAYVFSALHINLKCLFIMIVTCSRDKFVRVDVLYFELQNMPHFQIYI